MDEVRTGSVEEFNLIPAGHLSVKRRMSVAAAALMTACCNAVAVGPPQASSARRPGGATPRCSRAPSRWRTWCATRWSSASTSSSAWRTPTTGPTPPRAASSCRQVSATPRRTLQTFQVDPFWHPADVSHRPGVAVELEDLTKDSAGRLEPPCHADGSALPIRSAALQADVTVTALIAEDLMTQSTDAASMGRLSPVPRMA